jgi:ABC-type cobalt transport system substrate-binding protein
MMYSGIDLHSNDSVVAVTPRYAPWFARRSTSATTRSLNFLRIDGHL